MSDFELLSIVLMFLGILVTVIVAYIQGHEKVAAPVQGIGYFFIK